MAGRRDAAPRARRPRRPTRTALAATALWAALRVDVARGFRMPPPRIARAVGRPSRPVVGRESAWKGRAAARRRTASGVPRPTASAGRGARRDATGRTAATGDDDGLENLSRKNPFGRAIAKFRSRPGTYLTIPVIAAFVGWFTNWLAVQMIFYPVKFVGIPLVRRPEVPLGLIGWQGIVPCKARKMSLTMVDMVTSQLLSVTEVFGRLDPAKMAGLLAPEVPKIVEEVVSDLAPAPLVRLPRWLFSGLDGESRRVLGHLNVKFVSRFASDMIRDVQKVLSIENCVVGKMTSDRRLLGDLFKKCGAKELDFLTNSGLWFGFLLGLMQMAVALFWDNPWSLSVGGGIVGLATNWLALKWIFEPVNPTKIGPFVLQGQFLRRQKEVAQEFSTFFAERVLNSESVWNSILTDPVTSPEFRRMFGSHLNRFIGTISLGVLGMKPEKATVDMLANRAVQKLPDHVGVLHAYIDQTLDLKETLRVGMEKMSSSQFERVLHPIFEEDELTLILAGAALGFGAGLIQQGLETGVLSLPSWNALRKGACDLPSRFNRSAKKVCRRMAGSRVGKSFKKRLRAGRVGAKISSLLTRQDGTFKTVKDDDKSADTSTNLIQTDITIDSPIIQLDDVNATTVNEVAPST